MVLRRGLKTDGDLSGSAESGESKPLYIRQPRRVLGTHRSRRLGSGLHVVKCGGKLGRMGVPLARDVKARQSPAPDVTRPGAAQRSGGLGSQGSQAQFLGSRASGCLRPAMRFLCSGLRPPSAAFASPAQGHGRSYPPPAAPPPTCARLNCRMLIFQARQWMLSWPAGPLLGPSSQPSARGRSRRLGQQSTRSAVSAMPLPAAVNRRWSPRCCRHPAFLACSQPCR